MKMTDATWYKAYIFTEGDAKAKTWYSRKQATIWASQHGKPLPPSGEPTGATVAKAEHAIGKQELS